MGYNYEGQLRVPYSAGEDFAGGDPSADNSATSKRLGDLYKPVYVDVDGRVKLRKASDSVSHGILQTAPAKTGQRVMVVVGGISKGILGVATAVRGGTALMANASGELIARTGANKVVGTLSEDVAAGNQYAAVDILVNPDTV